MFSLIFLLIAILIVVRWYLILVLIFIFLSSDSGQLFMYLLVICIFLWEKNSKLHCIFIAMGYMRYLFFWTLTPYHIYELQTLSSIPWVSLSFCWWFPLLWWNFKFDIVLLVYFCFLMSNSVHYWQDQCQGSYLLWFLLKVLQFQILNSRHWIHFELIFVSV